VVTVVVAEVVRVVVPLLVGDVVAEVVTLVVIVDVGVVKLQSVKVPSP